MMQQHANTNYRKTGIPILIPDKISLQQRILLGMQKGHFSMLYEPIQQKLLITIDIYEILTDFQNK